MATAAAELSSIQTVRRSVLFAVSLGLITTIALTRSTLGGITGHHVIEAVGLALILACVLGRAWCSLYIGGRKVRELVTDGPYSLCRNPLYVLSVLGAVGIGALSGTVTLALLAGLLTFGVLASVVPQEERVLTQVHGKAFADYKAATPRFLPRFKAWHDAELLAVRPRRVATTLADGLLMLLAFPLAEGLEVMSNAGFIPVLLRLP